MSSEFALPVPGDILCRSILQNNVIPIIGNEVYQYKTAEGTAPVESWYAARLQQVYGMDEPALTTLTATVEYLVNEKKEDFDYIRSTLQTIAPEAEQLSFPLVEELLKVDAFRFYINTTPYGDIFKQALDTARETDTEIGNFTVMESFRGCDLPELTNPFLFNLFGSLKTSLTPALLEEEMLECVNLFIEKKGDDPLKQIAGEVSSKTLLFIGCSQPAWLTRFLFRNLSNTRLLNWDKLRRSGDIIVVNDASPGRDEFFSFLQKNHAKTYGGGVDGFIHQLAGAWNSFTSRNPPKPKEIFLSYSHRDAEAARRLCQKLSTIKNIKCWFDENRLLAGDNFRTGIAEGIISADLFMPLLSKNSIQAAETSLVTVKGEWGQANTINALRMQKNKGKEMNYIMPVAIDDVDLASPAILEFFDKMSIAPVPGGEAGDAFISQVKQKLNIA